VFDANATEWKLRHVPVGFINPRAKLALAAGSEVNAEVLFKEISELEGAGYDITSRLHVDPQATLLDDDHIAMEGASTLNARLGSTAKGVGAARSDRIWRTANLAGSIMNPVPVAELIEDYYTTDHDIIVEGTQGWGLGLHAGQYPYCTSGDARAIDMMAQAGAVPWRWSPDRLEVWVVFRTRPIRVAVNSGPLYGETTWQELGLPEEFTTVTKRVRRVGEWDPELAMEALAANGSPSKAMRVAITMLDHLFPSVAGATQLSQLDHAARVWLETREKEMGLPVDMVGTGPYTQVRMGVNHGTA
jgi:adenylosuccinate synthase